MPGLKMYIAVTLLEAIQLFEHRDRQGDVMFLKLKQTLSVVKNDVGVEHEQFCGGGRAARTVLRLGIDQRFGIDHWSGV